MTDVASDDSAPVARSIFILRLIVALLQAAALYGLIEAANAHPPSWPANDPLLFKPMVFIAFFVPWVVMIGLGQMASRPLALWMLAVTAVVGLLGYHVAARLPASEGGPLRDAIGIGDNAAGLIWGQVSLAFALFIAQALYADSTRERKFAPSYAAHFETAWKQCLQITLTLVFVGVFGRVLLLGAALFNLVKLDFFQKLIAEGWFHLPAGALATALAIHVTDARAQITRGARMMLLTLFSWLLPLLALILAGFLWVLPFVSLQPLWNTHHAGQSLLWAAIMLVVLVNAGYQDGAPARAQSLVKRLAIALGALEIAPLVGLAVYAIALRVEQYGWSVQRIEAGAVALALGAYALTYAAAVAMSPGGPKRIETANVAVAYLIVVVVLTLDSPLADPARLMVADQLARLRSGAVAAREFDYGALKLDGAKWGAAALAELRNAPDGPDAETIRAEAAKAENVQNRWQLRRTGTGVASAPPLTARAKARLVKVYPDGRELPPGLLELISGEAASPPAKACFSSQINRSCVARFLALRTGEPDALVLDMKFGGLEVFEVDANGIWRKTAKATNIAFTACASVSGAFERGDIVVAPHDAPDLILGGQRRVLQPIEDCPAPKK
jgi:hypothetical protein